MNVLVIDVGGTHVKLLASGESAPRNFVSGPALVPKRMVSSVKKIAGDWSYDVASIGYPRPVLHTGPSRNRTT
jgi:polyphosphate glucokinase